jgi:hypothetical protein
MWMLYLFFFYLCFKEGITVYYLSTYVLAYVIMEDMIFFILIAEQLGRFGL